MERGRTEQEIALFNTLVDFAFYCGTGAHTDEGLGQTRRMERPSPHPALCAPGPEWDRALL
jgi:hypothetical protein